MLGMVASNVALVLYQLLQLIFVARVFGQESVGQLGFCLAVISPIQIFWMANLRTLMQTASVEDRHVGELVAARAWQTMAFLATVLVASVFTTGITLGLLMSVAASKAVDMMLEMRMAVITREGKFRMLARRQLVRVLLSTLAFLVGAWTFQSMASGFLAHALILLPFAVREYRLATGISIFGGGTVFLARLRTDLALGGVSVGESLLAMLPRFVLMDKFGAAALGVFTVVYYFITAANVLVQAVSTYFSRRHGRGESGAVHGLIAVAGLGALAVGGAFMFGPWVIQLVFELPVDAQSVALLMLSGAFAYLYVYVYALYVGVLDPWKHLACFALILCLSWWLLASSAGAGWMEFLWAVSITRALQLLVLLICVMAKRNETKHPN
jgi:O-antigen/teichoic acid export membrane protein